jgi:DNA-binding transcriptional MerR regulator
MAGPLRSLAPRRLKKSPSAFRTISEVSEELDVPQHVLRFWGTKFTQVRPLKRGGGRRYYRPEDVRILERIRELLYRDGYTIRGVQRLFREEGVGLDASGASQDVQSGAGSDTALPPDIDESDEPFEGVRSIKSAGWPRGKREAVEQTIRELTQLRDLLRRHSSGGPE